MRKHMRLLGMLLAAGMLTGMGGLPISAAAEPAPAAAIEITAVPAAESGTQPAQNGTAAATTTTTTTTSASADFTAATESSQSATVTEAVSTDSSEADTVTTAAETAAETETTVTTLTEQKQELTAEIIPTYPGGKTALVLIMHGSTGLTALGLSITLPDVLIPQTNGEEAVFTPAEGLAGQTVYSYYRAEKHALSLAFAAKPGEAGAAEEVLGSFALDVSADAVIGETYPVEVVLDSIALAAGFAEFPAEQTVAFIPEEAPLRSFLSEVTLTEQGETVSLMPEPVPADGTEMVWRSSNPEAVTVDADGNITAVGSGKAEITLECETRTYVCAVTVEIKRTILPEEPVITEKGGTVQLTLDPVPNHAAVWSSADESVAVVDENGLVTAKANGSVRIRAACEGVSVSAVLRVDYPGALNYTEYAAKTPDDTLQLQLSDVSLFTSVTWESSDPSVASVDENGYVQFTGEGSAVITAVCGSYTYTCAVTNLPYLLGDIDADGEVSVTDVILALRNYTLEYVMGGDSELSALQKLAGDINTDGAVEYYDAVAILRYSTLASTGYPVTWDEINRYFLEKTSGE